jgi:multidrug efflux pump subunit AcrB
MWIVRLALRRPFTVAALCLAILLMGVLSAASMQVDIFPSINIPVVVVVWNYPGMSAEDMERRITFVSERGISTSVSGVTRIDSQSIDGTGVLRVYFDESADIGGAIAQISAASLSASRVMPPGTQPPVLLRYNASNVQVAQLTLAGNLSEQALFDYGSNFLRIRLFTIQGLATPAPYGGKQRQVMVDVDPTRAAANGLSPQDVVNAILAQNVILPAGSARMGHTDYDVMINGSPTTTEDFNALPVKVVNGATVYLGDVASVHDGFAVQQNVVRVDGKRATYLAILKKEDASTLAVVDATRDMLPVLKAAAPQGMDLKLEFDQSKFVRGAVWGVVREAAIAAGLVALMVLVFVGSWRSTFIVCISIPLSILVGVVGLKLTGQSLNLMTLGGLALAIGMLVDDATVEVENINRNRSLGKEMLPAILSGARQIALPALAATSVICIVFFPVVVLTGPSKYLFFPLALSVIFSMLASYLLSRTLVPTLASLLLAHEKPEKEDEAEGGAKKQGAHAGPGVEKGKEEKGEEKPKGRVGQLFARLDERRVKALAWLRDAYTHLLERIVERRKFVLVMAGLFVAASGGLVLVVGLDFFPSVDAGMLRLHFRAPPGTRIEETERIIDRVEHRIRDTIPSAEISLIDDNIGVPLYYNLGYLPSDNVDGADAEILVALEKKHGAPRGYVNQLRRIVRDEFPGSQLYAMQADVVSQVLNFGLAAPVDVQIESQDLEKAIPVARKLEAALANIPGTEDVRLAQVVERPTLYIDVDRSRAAQIGLSERDVASSLLTSLSSSSLVSPNFWVNPANRVSYSVAVQTPIQRIHDVGDLLATPITASGSSTGGGIISAALTPATATSAGFAPVSFTPAPDLAQLSAYVGAFAKLRTGSSAAVVNHVTVQPVLDVACNVEERDLGSVSSDIAKAVKNLGALPKGVSVHVAGQSETMRTAFSRLGLGMIVAIGLVYLLLVVLFQSWIDAAIILIAVPGAFSGILWLLTITGTTLNVESFMGAIMAIGIATSNSILLVNFANEQRSKKEHADPCSAAIAAGRTRLRPVLMTALAMILGMLPMALGLGEGGEQNAPLGRAVIGGLLVATPMTLFVVPSAYALFRKKKPMQKERDETVTKADEESRDDDEERGGEKHGEKHDEKHQKHDEAGAHA